MTPPAAPERDKNHRCPGESISHGAWRSYRFPLRSRDVQELLLARGIDVIYAAIRQWCLQCGQDFAPQLKRRHAQPGDTWHLGAVCLTMHGQRHDWWCAVDHDDHVRDILGQRRRNKHAAQQCFRKVLTGVQDVPCVRITDQRKRDGAAQRERLPGGAHRQRASRLPGLQSAGPAPLFVSAYGPLAQHCRPRRHLLVMAAYREEMRSRFASWAEIMGTERAA